MKDHEQINEKEVVKLTYAEQIKHPKWQKKRLEILERDGFSCKICEAKDKQLSVHHIVYRKGHEIWDYDNKMLLSVCDDCHIDLHEKIHDLTIMVHQAAVIHGIDVVDGVLNLLASIITEQR